MKNYQQDRWANGFSHHDLADSMPKKEGGLLLKIKAIQFNELSPFVVSGDLGKRKKCQEIDAAGAMHRFGDMGVWRVFCKTE